MKYTVFFYKPGNGGGVEAFNEFLETKKYKPIWFFGDGGIINESISDVKELSFLSKVIIFFKIKRNLKRVINNSQLIAVHDPFTLVALNKKELKNVEYYQHGAINYILANIPLFLRRKFMKKLEKVRKVFCLAPSEIDGFKKICKRSDGYFIADITNKYLDTYVNKHPKKVHDFIFIGRLDDNKNIMQVVDLFKNSKRSLSIFGDGPLKKNLIEEIKNYKNISYFGKTDNPIFEMEKSNNLILLSKSEGLPLVFKEAKKAGINIVSWSMSEPVAWWLGANGYEFAKYNDINKIKILGGI